MAIFDQLVPRRPRLSSYDPNDTSEIDPMLNAIRARGRLRQQNAYRTGLGNAAGRGVGLGGLAQQEINPLVAEASATTEEELLGAKADEKARLEAERREKEANRGFFDRMFG